jgi:hypothetical protein
VSYWVNKVLITKWILICANKFPIIFPYWLVEYSKYHLKERGEPKHKSQEIDDAFEKASLLELPFFIKAVSVIVKINSNELDSIHTWLKRQGSASNYNPNRDQHSFNARFDQGDSFRNLGWIRFNSDSNFMSLANIPVKNTFCSSCYVTIKKFPSGLCYLSLYIMLDESGNSLVTDFDVTHIQETKSFRTFNPFSKQRKVLEYYNRKMNIKEVLNQNLNILTNDAITCSQKVLTLFGVKKSQKELVIVKDVVVDSATPYFDKDSHKEQEISETYTLFKRDSWYLDDQFSDDAGEHYCESDSYLRELLSDAIFIKSEPQDDLDEHFSFSKTGLNISDSHLFISTLLLCFKEYNSISKSINEGLLNGHSIPEKYYKPLFKGLLELKALKLNVNAITKSINWSCPNKYELSVKSIIKHLNQRIDELTTTANEQIDFARDSIQANNLKFHKRYSLVIALLVVTQIALAINFENVKNLINSFSTITFESKVPTKQEPRIVTTDKVKRI